MDSGDIAQVLSRLATLDEPSPGLPELVTWQLRRWGVRPPLGDIWAWLAEEPLRRSRCLIACSATAPYQQHQAQWLSQEGYEPDEIREGMHLVSVLPDDVRIPPTGLSLQLRQLLEQELTSQLVEHGVSAIKSLRSGLPPWGRPAAADGFCNPWPCAPPARLPKAVVEHDLETPHAWVSSGIRPCGSDWRGAQAAASHSLAGLPIGHDGQQAPVHVERKTAPQPLASR